MNKLAVVILTLNEARNITKCLQSIKALGTDIYIIDSFSTDNTKEIALSFGAKFFTNTFETHTKQWKYALSVLPVDIEWVLGLDADQELSVDLQLEINQLQLKNDLSDGYYICRRNYFLGKWIRFGGYYPRFLLKLFRKDKVTLDDTELMDHHFYINGPTAKLKHDLIENNLNEDLAFWKNKHRKYAILQATEEYQNLNKPQGSVFGNQDERRLYFKKIWNSSPLFLRPFLYFFIRMFLQFGFLDGPTGIKFHFLQSFWYRLKVDQHIYQLKSQNSSNYQRNHFLIWFSLLSIFFYYFNLAVIAMSAKGGIYSQFISNYLNYIQLWRDGLIYCSVSILNILGYISIGFSDYIRVVDGIRVNVGFSCIGFGVVGVYAALLIAYPLQLKTKITLFIKGFLIINLLNILRIILVTITYSNIRNVKVDHHLLFNIVVYSIILLMMYFTVKKNKNVHSRH